MHYQFSGGAVGECRVEMRTSGRHGFASPKFFRITCMDDSKSTGLVTFRFTDKFVDGLNAQSADAFNNATLCRIAIAQFLRSAAHAHAGATIDLDTAIRPFDGPVLNAHGVVLTVSRLRSPRGMARAAECAAATNRHGREPQAITGR